MKYNPSILGVLMLGAVAPAFAQTVITTTEVREGLPGVVHTLTPSSVVQRRVLTQPVVVHTQTQMPLSVAAVRSNYAKRLSGIKEQIDLALQRGWISAERHADLSKWHSDLVNEERGLRANNQGIIAASDVDMMERHVNGLAYSLAKELSSGKQVAGTGVVTY